MKDNKAICQCCGMPLEDDTISKEKDGTPNNKYCVWCYSDGKFTYTDMNVLIDACVGFMANESFPEAQVRTYMSDLLPKLDYWKNKK